MNTRSHSPKQGHKLGGEILICLSLLAFGGLTFFWGLSQDGDIETHGGRHAEIAREMVDTGQYAAPHLLGTPYTMKPPLYHWVAAGLFKLSGITDWRSARLPSALATLAAMLAIYVLGRIWFNTRAGIWSALTFATFPMVVAWARQARMDALMSGLILYSVLFCVLAAKARGNRALWLTWSMAWLCLAGAVLSKGLSPLLFLAVAVPVVWRTHRGIWLPPGRLVVTGLVILIVCLGILSCVSNKRAHYLLPLMPFAAIAIGSFLSESVSRLSAPAPERVPASDTARGRLFLWPLELCLAMVLVAAVGGALVWAALGLKGLAPVWLCSAGVAGAALLGVAADKLSTVQDPDKGFFGVVDSWPRNKGEAMLLLQFERSGQVVPREALARSKRSEL